LGADAGGAYTLVINTLPQVAAIEAHSLLPGVGDLPGGPTTSLVLVFQGDRLNVDAPGEINVYADKTPGRESVDRARAALSAEDVARATEVGRRLTIKEALDLARSGETAPS
jgi:hypothetical protein